MTSGFINAAYSFKNNLRDFTNFVSDKVPNSIKNTIQIMGVSLYNQFNRIINRFTPTPQPPPKIEEYELPKKKKKIKLNIKKQDNTIKSEKVSALKGPLKLLE